MRYLLILAIALAAGCSSRPAVLAKGTDSEIRAEAVRLAHEDIAGGHLRVCLAGGRAAETVGVAPEAERLVRDLPKWNISKGCTDSLVQRAAVFAEAYNHEIVASLSQNKHE